MRQFNTTVAGPLLLVALSALASPVLAQTQPRPPIYYSLDRNGVDLVTGDLNAVTSEVAIGPPGAGGLTYGRIAIKNGWRDLAIGGLNCVSDDCLVSLGSASAAFTRIVYLGTPIFTPVSNEGSQLLYVSGAYNFVASDGTSATLAPVSGSNPYSANVALLTSVTAPGGLTQTYHYTTVGSDQRLQAITNNLGYQIHYRYDSVSTTTVEKVVGFNMANEYCAPTAANCNGLTGNWPSVTYARSSDGAGGINEYATDQSGRTTLYHRDPNNQLDAVRLPGQTGYQIAVLRNGSGQVSQASGPYGVWNYAYSTSGPTRDVIATGPSGQSTEVTTSLTVGQPYFVRQITATSPYMAVSDYQFSYDSQNRLTSIAQPEGNSLTYTLDARGNATQTVATSKDGMSTITTSATYPSPCMNLVTCNSPTTTTDGRGQVTNYVWNTTHGGIESVTLPAPTTGAVRPQTRYSYADLHAWYKNSAGTVVQDATTLTLPSAVSTCATGSTASPTCVGTANEILTTVAYDTSGAATNLQPISTTTGAATGSARATTSFVYNEDGDLASVSGPLSGDTTVYVHDDARQTIGVIGPDPDGGGALLNRAQRVTYSLRGQPTLVEAGTTPGQTLSAWGSFSTLQRQASRYDDFGRGDESRQQSAGGTTRSLQQVSYDASGRPECSATRMNPASFASPPTSACTLSTASAPYGAYGPDRIARTTYDLADRPLAVTTGYGVTGAQMQAVTYTDNNQIATLTDGRGSVSTMEYDGFDRLARLIYPNPSTGAPSTSDDELYGYDANANPVTFTNRANQAFTTTYDNLNRPTVLTAPSGTPSVTFTYDNLGRPLQAAVPGVTTSMTWDGLGRQITETGPTGTMTYSYDIAGRRTTQTWPDSFAVGYTWDVTHAMKTITRSGVDIVTYGYDNLGRRATMSRSNGIGTTYAYDDVSRLTGLTHGGSTSLALGFTYNPAGQFVSRTMSNSAYAYAGPSGTTNHILDRLNRISSANSVAFSYDANSNLTNDGTLTYAYDAANRLSSNGTSSATITYDGLGRLDVLVGSNGARYVYDGAEAIALANASTNAIDNHFVRGPGTDEIVANYPTATLTSPLFWMLDQQNSLMALTNTSGATPYTNGYDEYGNPRSGNLGRFQYTGQLRMPDFGAYHYKARAYAPGMGRFLQTDPMGYTAGANLYGYVGGDPTNWTDPLGLQETCVTDGNSPTGETCTPTPRGPSPVDRARQVWGDFQLSFWITISGGLATNGDEYARGITNEAFGCLSDPGCAYTVAAPLQVFSWTPAPIQIGKLTTSTGVKITGFTSHGEARLLGVGRPGVNDGALRSALTNPRSVTSGIDSLGRPYQIYRGDAARVVINPSTGEIVSVNPLGRAGVR